jgi:hypothetical protein
VLRNGRGMSDSRPFRFGPPSVKPYNGTVSNTASKHAAGHRAAGMIGRTARIILLTCFGLISSAAGVRSSSDQPPAPDPRFGIVETFVNPAAAGEAGAGYSRIILRWDVIQPASPLDWKPANVPDPLIAEELAAGREVVAVLIGTPAWASAEGGHDARDVPDMFYWQAFVRRMAQQYQGRIRNWIIWNEPDVWDANHPGSTWTGSETDYYRLLKTAYLAIKDVDPSLQVHIAGLTYYWDWAHGRRRYLDRLLDVMVADPEAATHGYYFDGLIYHLYFNPNQTVDVLEETRQALSKRGISGREIWINETNAPPSDDSLERPWSKPRFRVSLQEQAAFVIQEFALAFSSGASRVEVYKLRNTADHPESIEPFGLLRADDSRRPAFAAYQTVTSYLRDFRAAYRQRSGNVVAVTFDRGDKTTTVLWTTGWKPTRVPVGAIAPEALLVDEGGRVRKVNPVSGAYWIDLPGATCSQPSCMIGGAPRMLVEAGRANGRQALGAPALPVPTQPPSPKARGKLNDTPNLR